MPGFLRTESRHRRSERRPWRDLPTSSVTSDSSTNAMKLCLRIGRARGTGLRRSRPRRCTPAAERSPRGSRRSSSQRKHRSSSPPRASGSTTAGSDAVSHADTPRWRRDQPVSASLRSRRRPAARGETAAPRAFSRVTSPKSGARGRPRVNAGGLSRRRSAERPPPRRGAPGAGSSQASVEHLALRSRRDARSSRESLEHGALDRNSETPDRRRARPNAVAIQGAHRRDRLALRA